MQTTKTIPPLTAADAAATVVVGAAALALYLRTLVPYPLPGDSGEFQVLVHQLGAAHTTGYSTYLLLGHLFEQLVPWGDVAWRVNLFSAVMAALAVALVYLAGKLLTGSGPAAVVGALSLSVGFTFWSQAMPNARLAHFGPTPLNESSSSRSQGSSPPCSARSACRAAAS